MKEQCNQSTSLSQYGYAIGSAVQANDGSQFKVKGNCHSETMPPKQENGWKQLVADVLRID